MGRIPSSFGIWISPLGGYFGPEKRVQHAKDKGILPEDAAGFDLSCPKYYEWFKKRCSDLMKKDKVTYFKWDKAGDGISPHFMALLSIASELRRENPRLFINTTVGTWPSPFWLNHVDSTWRSGTADVGWTGKGNDREQWITFRDGACYNVIVKPGPLYPLNSIMHHGMVLGTKFQAERVSKGEDGKQDNRDLKNDARIYFGSGANLQELYLTPSMMDKRRGTTSRTEHAGRGASRTSWPMCTGWAVIRIDWNPTAMRPGVRKDVLWPSVIRTTSRERSSWTPLPSLNR